MDTFLLNRYEIISSFCLRVLAVDRYHDVITHSGAVLLFDDTVTPAVIRPFFDVLLLLCRCAGNENGKSGSVGSVHHVDRRFE